MTVKRPPPHTSDSNHLHNHANRARKSWRSDVPIILPGWERHTGGSRSIPTVHPVRTSVGRLWVAQTTSISRAQTSNPTGGQVPHGSGAQVSDPRHSTRSILTKWILIRSTAKTDEPATTVAASALEPAAEPPVETTEADREESLIDTKMMFPRNLIWHSAQE